MSINVQNSTNRVIITPPNAPRRIIISSKGTQGATGAYFRVVDSEADLIPSFGNDRDTAITIIDGLEYYKANGVWSATGRTFWGTLLQDTSAYAISAAASAASAASDQAATSADRIATGQDKLSASASAAASETSNQASAGNANNAASSEVNAANSAANAHESALQTASDIVETAANLAASIVAKTDAEAAAVKTGQDKAATAADRSAVANDKVATTADRTETNADRVQTGLDKTAAADSASTASTKANEASADRVQTGLDRAATEESAALASAKADEAASSAVLTAADRVATGQDKDAAQSARTGAEAARDIALSTYANLAGGTIGQIPVKASGSDFDFAWGNPAVGDMLSSTWADTINSNTAARHSHSNKSVLDATTAAFTTAAQTKLAGIPADADKTPTLAVVATSGSYNDLANKPAIPAAQVASDWNAASGVTAIANKPALAAVATSGAYSDLSGRPTIPAAQAQTDWNAASGISSIANKPSSFPPSTHTHTKDQVGLSNVDNTSDVNKPVSSQQQTALDLKLEKTAQAADSARLNGKTEAGLVVSGPIADAIAAAATSGGGVGVNQAWQAVSRTMGTAYQNTTGNPIEVSITARQDHATNKTTITIALSSNGTNFVTICSGNTVNTVPISAQFIVPPGHFYRWTRSGVTLTAEDIQELR